MPIEVENKLKARARKKGFKGKRADRYVYGTMNKLGLLEANQSVEKLNGYKVKKENFSTIQPFNLLTLSRIHPRLVALAAKIDLGTKPEGAGCCSPCDVPRSPYYPTLYVSGRKQPIDIPEKGKATVEYRVRSRSSNKQGEEDERHSADIEIHSIEAHEPEPEAKKQSALFEDVRRLRMFAKGIQIRRAPFRITRLPATGELRVAPTRKLAPRTKVREGMSYYTDDVQDARDTAAAMIRRYRNVVSARRALKGLSSLERLIEFADPRARNSLGEYTSDPGEGVDPNQMAVAYGPPQVSQSHMERIRNFFGKRRAKAEVGSQMSEVGSS